MTPDDPVDAVIIAFLDHLEGGAPRPSLDHLDADDRRTAQALLDGLATARGIDPDATRPSIEALLTGTPLAGLLPALGHPVRGAADLATVELVLAGVDGRVRVSLDDAAGSVVCSHLDLRARFVLVAGGVPELDEATRRLVGSVFAADPDTSRVGVVAAASPELVTLVVSPDDVADAVVTTGPGARRRREPALPLPLAARRMLEQSAPEWPAYDVGPVAGEPFDVAALAGEIARRVIDRESARAYRGDKRAAYQALVGQADAIAELVARVCTPGARIDLDRETSRIARVAA